MTPLQRWTLALKPASWLKLLLPILWGQAVGVHRASSFFPSTWTWMALGLGLLLGICHLAFIVLLNDWGDQRVDGIKRELFPQGGGPKTIYDGLLTPAEVLQGGVIAGLCFLSFALVGGLYFERLYLPLFACGALGMYLAYTFPPLKLNYRGGGELLEALGIGVVLPWMHGYLQSGTWDYALCGFLPISLASALCSGLADEESDRVGGKHTVVLWLGNETTKRCITGLFGIQALWWWGTTGLTFFWTLPERGMISLASLLLVSLVSLASLATCYRLTSMAPKAVTRAFPALHLYRKAVHQSVWILYLLGLLSVLSVWNGL